MGTTRTTEKSEVTFESETGKKNILKKETVTDKDSDGKIISQKTETEETTG
jgi:hypothetical protein